MTNNDYLVRMTRDQIKANTSIREGETKAGQSVQLPDPNEQVLANQLSKLYDNGCHYAVVLIPEDIGPRANLGRRGAHRAPEAFLKYFLNVQANRYSDYSKVAVLGSIQVQDLMTASTNASTEKLRELCAEIDKRVAAVIEAVARAGLCPIVIGGGNNNSFPIITGVCDALREQDPDQQVAVVNCDPHADFRRLEGRHSGNPFSYAAHNKLLNKYAVFGLHENYNNEEMLQRLHDGGFAAFSYEDFAINGTETYESSLKKMVAYISSGGCPVGCEVDVDSIKLMPSSARTPFGITAEQAAEMVHRVASTLPTAYLHLSEGAPECGADEGALQVGKTLTLLAVTFVKAREQFQRQNPG